MSRDVNPFELAGTTQPPVALDPNPDTAVEVFPVTFEKDDLDFRGVVPEDEPVIPKASSAPVSVETPQSVTGLEDVSTDDLETSAQNNVEKDTTSQPELGSLTLPKAI